MEKQHAMGPCGESCSMSCSGGVGLLGEVFTKKTGRLCEHVKLTYF